jgi:hypothetical protein
MNRIAAIVLLALPALCAAQAEVPVPGPEVKVGDRWIYHHWDHLDQKLVKTYELRVSFADRNVIHTVVTRQDKHESDAMWTSEWNSTQSVLGEGVVDPHTGSGSWVGTRSVSPQALSAPLSWRRKAPGSGWMRPAEAGCAACSGTLPRPSGG